MVITEIFRSIQGESTYAGLPCIFVRLTGCNLRCTWCDTAYAFHGGTKMSIEEVLARVHFPELAPDGGRPVASADSLVELTGGEPLLQPEAVPLAERLLPDVTQCWSRPAASVRRRAAARSGENRGREVPGFGRRRHIRMDNLEVLDSKDEVKFVIASRRDYEFATRLLHRSTSLPRRVRQVLFSPVFAGPEGRMAGTGRALARGMDSGRRAARAAGSAAAQIHLGSVRRRASESQCRIASS